MPQVQAIHLEYRDFGSNNQKYYRIYNLGGRTAVAYGRIGAKPQWQIVTAVEGGKRYHEKLNKGYTHVSDWITFAVSNAITDAIRQNGTGATPALAELARTFDQVVGNNIKAAKASTFVDPSIREKEEEDELKATLLNLAKSTKVKVPEQEAKPTGPAPDSMEGLLKTALDKAKAS